MECLETVLGFRGLGFKVPSLAFRGWSASSLRIISNNIKHYVSGFPRKKLAVDTPRSTLLPKVLILNLSGTP